ncbi:DUF3365 domain-containing protein, partial [bacterium]
VVLSLVMGVSFYFISKSHENLIIEQVDSQARSLFRQIVLTRKWVANHGGVFVEKVPWKDPNPYLIESEIVDVKGRKYIKESPAMVTKELSQYAKEKGLYWFHITSLKLINPENAPDEFEKTALLDFEARKSKERSRIETIGGDSFYRYVAPLYIEQSCLKCHAQQGYSVGDVRGAISVSVPMDHALSVIRSSKRGMVLASVVTITILMIVLSVMMKELVLRPVKQLMASMQDFSRSDKSALTVIRTGDELENLSKSFVEMSRKLSDYHSGLQNKVSLATKSLEQVNARLRELNEKKSDFIATISHELRTPMTSIKGAMDYLRVKIPKISQNSDNTEEIIEFLDVIKKNADRLIRMVSDTINLERIESGIFELHPDQFDLISLIKEAIIEFQTVAAGKNITFKIVAHSEVFINADEDMIRQVVINLISNSLNYSPRGSEIIIAVTYSDTAVTVSFTDKGPGIPENVRNKIFDKFYTIGKRHGTGLGLAICKGIIEAHQGEIMVASTQKGIGSTISFTLPDSSTGIQ